LKQNRHHGSSPPFLNNGELKEIMRTTSAMFGRGQPEHAEPMQNSHGIRPEGFSGLANPLHFLADGPDDAEVCP